MIPSSAAASMTARAIGAATVPPCPPSSTSTPTAMIRRDGADRDPPGSAFDAAGARAIDAAGSGRPDPFDAAFTVAPRESPSYGANPANHA